MEFRAAVGAEQLLGSIERAFPADAQPPVRSAQAKPVQLGTYAANGVQLRIVDTSRAGWLGPRFEGVVESTDGGSRLLGKVKHDLFGLALMGLVGFLFFAYLVALFVTTLSPVLGLAVAITLAGAAVAAVFAMQRASRHKLLRAVTTAVEQAR